MNCSFPESHFPRAWNSRSFSLSKGEKLSKKASSVAISPNFHDRSWFAATNRERKMREREDYFGVNVDKLSMAMEDAGKEFQAAVARSGVSGVSGRDEEGSVSNQEMQELRQILVSKDRAIDSLRSTLEGQRSAMEGRIAQTEKLLGQRDEELGAVRDELEGMTRAKAVAEAALKREVDAVRRSKGTAKSELEELRAKLRQALSEASDVNAQLRVEREKTDRLRTELEQTMTREAMTREQLRLEADEHKETQRILEKHRNEHVRDKENQAVSAASVHGDLERRLQASEQLLKTELKSREEMEYLLLALRDLAMNKNKPSTSRDNQEQMRLVKQELFMLRSEEERDMKKRREEYDAHRQTLQRHQESLAAELAEMRTTMELMPFVNQRSNVQISRMHSDVKKQSEKDANETDPVPTSPVSFVVPLRDRYS